jgi:hypothetical protein
MNIKQRKMFENFTGEVNFDFFMEPTIRFNMELWEITSEILPLPSSNTVTTLITSKILEKENI